MPVGCRSRMLGGWVVIPHEGEVVDFAGDVGRGFCVGTRADILVDAEVLPDILTAKELEALIPHMRIESKRPLLQAPGPAMAGRTQLPAPTGEWKGRANEESAAGISLRAAAARSPRYRKTQKAPMSDRGFLHFCVDSPTFFAGEFARIASPKRPLSFQKCGMYQPPPLRGRSVPAGKKVLLIDSCQATQEGREAVLRSHRVDEHAAEDLSRARQLESYFADGVNGLHCARYPRLFDFGNYIVDVHRSAAHPKEAAAEIAESSPVRRRGAERIVPNTFVL